MRPHHWLLCATLAATALSASGCESAREALSQRQATLDAREAVLRYAAAVPATLPLHEAWMRQLRDVRDLTDAAAISKRVLEKVVPALDSYTRAIEAVATDPAFAAAHQALVAAHHALSEALVTFATGLERRGYPARRAALSLAMLAFDRAQLFYDEAMKTHYSSVGLTYTPPPPVAW